MEPHRRGPVGHLSGLGGHSAVTPAEGTLCQVLVVVCTTRASRRSGLLIRRWRAGTAGSIISGTMCRQRWRRLAWEDHLGLAPQRRHDRLALLGLPQQVTALGVGEEPSRTPSDIGGHWQRPPNGHRAIVRTGARSRSAQWPLAAWAGSRPERRALSMTARPRSSSPHPFRSPGAFLPKKPGPFGCGVVGSCERRRVRRDVRRCR